MAFFKVLSGVCMQTIRKTTRDLGPGKCLNQIPPKYESDWLDGSLLGCSAKWACVSLP
jgi:hypothetical protein